MSNRPVNDKNLCVISGCRQLTVFVQIVEISQAQMAALCGNVLELENGDGLPVLAMSSQASLFHPVPLSCPPNLLQH